MTFYYPIVPEKPSITPGTPLPRLVRCKTCGKTFEARYPGINAKNCPDDRKIRPVAKWADEKETSK